MDFCSKCDQIHMKNFILCAVLINNIWDPRYQIFSLLSLLWVSLWSLIDFPVQPSFIYFFLEKQLPEVFHENRCSYKFRKIHRKTPVPDESLF